MHILYALDGSRESLAGAQMLRAWNLPDETVLRLLIVLSRHEPRALAQSALDTAREALEGCPAKIVGTIRRGEAASEIIDEIVEAAGEMIEEGEAPGQMPRPALTVVGSHGRHALQRFLLGSVAEKVARHAPGPVLVARPLRGAFDRILVALDGSGSADYALAYLNALPIPRSVGIAVASIVTPADLISPSHFFVPGLSQELHALAQREQEGANLHVARSAETLRAAGWTDVRTLVRADTPANGLIALQEELKADLLVMGAKGMGAMDRFLLGSVSEKVLRHARCSVLVVREDIAAG